MYEKLYTYMMKHENTHTHTYAHSLFQLLLTEFDIEMEKLSGKSQKSSLWKGRLYNMSMWVDFYVTAFVVISVRWYKASSLPGEGSQSFGLEV